MKAWVGAADGCSGWLRCAWAGGVWVEAAALGLPPKKPPFMPPNMVPEAFEGCAGRAAGVIWLFSSTRAKWRMAGEEEADAEAGLAARVEETEEDEGAIAPADDVDASRFARSTRWRMAAHTTGMQKKLGQGCRRVGSAAVCEVCGAWDGLFSSSWPAPALPGLPAEEGRRRGCEGGQIAATLEVRRLHQVRQLCERRWVWRVVDLDMAATHSSGGGGTEVEVDGCVYRLRVSGE